MHKHYKQISKTPFLFSIWMKLTTVPYNSIVTVFSSSPSTHTHTHTNTPRKYIQSDSTVVGCRVGNHFLGLGEQKSSLSTWIPISMVMVKVKFTLEQAMKAQRGSRGTALLFL
jgi:hypothetical protein